MAFAVTQWPYCGMKLMEATNIIPSSSQLSLFPHDFPNSSPHAYIHVQYRLTLLALAASLVSVPQT
jgi:hypothetical protein